MSDNRSEAEKVYEFTSCAGQPVKNYPEIMTKDEVYFLVKMILDEVMELCSTVDEAKEVKQKLISLINESKDIPLFSSNTQEEIIAEQADALVDINYYGLNAMAKKGVNLSKIFDIVHNSNMTKRNPVTGVFEKRADGKIIKPPSFIEPDVTGEIIQQKEKGAFNVD